mmetsp:Transcript_8123/g.20803  ORF Transcript_8123/g.20803 Transcript_8123/m.20803 type:complete len:145 (-) Transcript_8123:413-847(-)
MSHGRGASARSHAAGSQGYDHRTTRLHAATRIAHARLSPRNSEQTNTHVFLPPFKGMTMGLFGLGPPEIAVILAVGGFVLGPTKLAELARDFGKVAGELKDVPKEFQEGLAEGEAETRKLRDADVPTEKVETKVEEEAAEKTEA